MRVLLTGASGFLGSYVHDCLRKSGIRTVVAGRTCPIDVSPSDFVAVDFLGECDFRSVVEESKATHLMHFAWYAEHGKYWTSPLNLRWTEASVRLVEAFCSAGAQKVVIAGTCAEYDWSHGYCREDVTPINPGTFYGIAKDATRRLVEAVCAESNIPFAWGRIFLPYGEGEDRRRLIPSLVDVFKHKRPPFGVNATAYRDFLHAEDLAKGFEKLLQSDATGSFNICSGQPVQIADVVRQVADHFGADANAVLSLSTSRPGEPDFLVGDNKKIEMLGWRPEYSFVDGLRKTEL
jgi:nucleoside-diphosphate-sugar epimerase